LGKCLRVLQWKMLVYFLDIWYILWTFGIFCGHLVYFVDIWYILWTLGIFCSNMAYIFPFWYVSPRKIWQPCSRGLQKNPRHILSCYRTFNSPRYI
jgi:hypothetical protein